MVAMSTLCGNPKGSPMPTKAPSVCANPGCSHLTTGTRCPAHQTIQNKAWKNEAKQKVYRSARWKGLRTAQLRRAPWCETPGCTNLATDVDHILDFEDERDPLCWDWSNLASLCKRHHSEKTARTVWGRK